MSVTRFSQTAMATVTVYYFTMYDIQYDKVVRSQRPATRETIERFRGIVQEDTAEEVDASRLDENGLLVTD